MASRWNDIDVQYDERKLTELMLCVAHVNWDVRAAVINDGGRNAMHAEKKRLFRK